MIDCNDCPHLNITEKQQTIIHRGTGRNFVPHICMKYKERVLHYPYREPMIHPCPQCEKEKESTYEHNN